MKLRLSKVAATLLLGLFSLPALAGSGWYVAADVGQSNFSGGLFGSSPEPASWVRSTSETSTGYRLAGGYQFTPNWGLEGGYVDLGHGTASYRNPKPEPFNPDATTMVSDRIGVKGFFVAGTGTYPINEQWSLFARLGVVDARLDDQAHANGNINIAGQNDTSWKATYGLGAKWNFQPQWSLRLGWDSYRQLGPSSPVGQYDVSLLSLGVEWRFF